jgi:hypothetical protein
MRRCLLFIAILLAGAPARAQPSRPGDTAGGPLQDGEPAGDDVQGSDAAAPGVGAALPWVVGVPVEQRREANRIFQEGNALMREGLFARAVDAYQQALALWDHPGFRYNLAIAQVNLDQPIAAYESLLHATRHGARPLGDDLFTQAQSFLTLLHNQLAQVEVTCDEPGAVVTLDGKPLFAAPGRAQIMALPGGHQLMADKAGRLPDTRQIVLSPGQHARFSLAPQAPIYVATERRWPAWRPWAVASAGVGVVAVGGVVNWRSSSAFADVRQAAERECTRTSGCDAAPVTAALRDQRDRATRLQLGARAIYAVGGAVLATSAVLFYLNRERPVRRRERADAVHVSLVPVLAPQFAGMSAQVRF